MKSRKPSKYRAAVALTTAKLKSELAADGRAEYRIHCAIVEYLNRARRPGVIFWHTPNGARRGPREAHALRSMGMLAGVSDIILSLPDGRMCFMEIKTRDGNLTEAQELFFAAMKKNGHRTAVVRSPDEADIVLISWGAVGR